jgi:hypothetical protein
VVLQVQGLTSEFSPYITEIMRVDRVLTLRACSQINACIYSGNKEELFECLDLVGVEMLMFPGSDENFAPTVFRFLQTSLQCARERMAWDDVSEIEYTATLSMITKSEYQAKADFTTPAKELETLNSMLREQSIWQYSDGDSPDSLCNSLATIRYQYETELDPWIDLDQKISEGVRISDNLRFIAEETGGISPNLKASQNVVS